MPEYRSLRSAKAGDRLSLGYRGGWNNEFLPTEILTVEAVGTNYIKAGGRTWKMSDGCEWGKKYSSVQIGLFGPEDEKQWAETREKNLLKAQIPHNFYLDRCDLKTLRKVIPILFPKRRAGIRS